MKKSTLEILQKQWRHPHQWIAGFLMLFVLAGTNAFAQTVTLGSGTATSTASTTGTGLGPVNSYYEYMHYQVVYTAAEITAAGGTAQNISQFGWNVATASGAVLPNYRIRMALTTATNSAAHNTSALTEVYNASYTSTTGFNMFTLTSPFVWDGTSNILVDVCYGLAPFTTPYGQVYVYGTDANSSRYSREDGTAQCGVSTDRVNAFKPQARFEFAPPPSCLVPLSPVSSLVGTTTATVSWTAPATAPASGYQYYISTTNTAPAANATVSGSVPTGTTLSLTNLPSQTTQYVWLRSNCGTDNVSSWTGPVSFTTLQVAATLPFTDGFEGTPSWILVNGTQINKWFIGTATNNGGSKSLYVSNDNGVTNSYDVDESSVVQAYRDITLPADIVQANLTFDWRGAGESTFDYLRIWAVPTTFTPTAGTQIAEGTGRVQLEALLNGSATYNSRTYVIPAAAYAGQTIRLVFEWRNDGSDGDDPAAAIDNVSVTTVTCFAPTAITAVTTPGTVNVSWTAAATAPAAGYDYYYSTTNTAPTATTTPSGNVATGTTVSLTTLTSDTVYYIWVRSNCGGTDASVWTSGGSFRTECLASTPSATYETFASYDGTAASPACWKEATGALTATPAAVTLGNSNWTNENYNNTAGTNGRAARVELYSTRNAWLISPAIDLGTGTTDYQLEYTASVIPWSGTTAVTAMGEKYVKVVVSTDGGATWAEANVVRTYNNANIPSAGVLETIQLGSYTGVVKIGFYGFSTSTDQDLRFYIDNFRVREVPNCLNPIAPTFGTVGETTAVISWTAPASAPSNGYEYYVSTINTAPIATTTATGSVGAGVLTATVSGLTPSTQNYVWVRSNCGEDRSEWVGPVSLMTLCDAPEITSSTGATICGLGTATLNAVADGGTISWYAAETGGTALFTGESFVTPQISETTTYYVTSSVTGTATAGGGKVVPSYSDAGTTPDNYGVVFTATSSFTLNSVDVFLNSTTAGNVVVVLQSNTGTELQRATVAVPAGNATTPVQFSLNLGWTIPVGTGYRLLAVSGPSMIREFSPVFPYAIGASGNITGGYSFGSSSTAYYFFYNFNFTGVCSAPRVAVVATVTTAPAIELAATDAAICAGESTTLSVTSDNDDYTYVWTPGTDLTGESQVVSPAATTTYTVTATDAVSGCVTTEEITVTVNALPTAIVLTPTAATICPETVQAITATGALSTGAATIGNATTLTGDREELTAFSNRRASYKSQTIYTAAELNAAGMQAGTITSIAYNIASVGDSATNNNYTVKIGTTANAAFATTNYVSETGFTTVYGPATYTHAIGFNTVTFATPYVWDGVSNLVISVSHLGADDLDNATTYYTDLGANTTLYNFDNLTATTGTLSTKRFNVTFNYSATNTIAWAPATGLFTDAAATVAYTNQNVATVYAKPAETTTYTVTATTALGCAVTATAVINVGAATPAPAASATQTFCGTGIVGGLDATGTEIKWYENATGGIALVDDVALVDGAIYYASQTVDGCESITRTPVTVALTTVAVDDPEDVTQCGGTYTLPVLTNGAYYTESNGAGTMLEAGAMIEETTTLYVFATSATTPNCTNQSIFTVTINNTPAPTGVSPQTITVASGEEATIEDIEVTLTATGTVIWYATESDAIVGIALPAGTPLVEGSTYYATQIVGNCTSEEVLAVTIEQILGGKGFDLASFSYYPNPVSNVLNLTYSSEITSVAIFNLVGQQITVQQPNTTNAKVDTSMLAEGTYLVKVTAENAVKTIKIIKKN